MSITALPVLPSFDGAEVVVEAPGDGPGNWAGAASAVLVDGVYWLTWRNRRPLTEGRGVTVDVARSSDGVHFETVAEVGRDIFGCESLERPVLVPIPAGQGGGWRLYLSCATWDSKHWWVDSLTAATPEELPRGTRQVVLAGDDEVAVKDPVITVGTAGEWDERGARVTTPIGDGVFLYDGRPDAASNWFETTGVARWDGSRLVPDPEIGPIASPHSDGAFRYASAVPLPDGRIRYYVEAARADGAHDLITVVR